MSIFSLFRKHEKTADNRPEIDGGYGENLNFSDNFSIFYNRNPIGDAYSINAWVNIAVSILIRNLARADFVIKKGGTM